MSKPRLILRADGNERIGLGHVMRLLALAEIAGEGFACEFVVRPGLPAGTSAELAAIGATLTELPALESADAEAEWLARHFLQPTDTLVLDGYDFGPAYQQTVRAAVGALLYVDDMAAFPQIADVVLNPAGGVDPARYVLHRPGARLLIGPAWAPLRRPFREAAAHTTPVPAPVGQVLLCLGGADPANHTQRLAAELLPLPTIHHLYVAVGSAYRHYEELTAWSNAQNSARLTLHHALPAEAFAALLARCGTAITSASTVSYEYAATGGLLTIVRTADNQQGIYDFLLREGLARPATALPNILSAPDRAHIQAILRVAQRRHFDGQAPVRLRQLLLSLSAQAHLALRPATAADSARLLMWANDSVTRQFSYTPTPVAPANHERWLAARLLDPQYLLLIASVADTPAGTIRFALSPEGTAVLSFALAPEFRGLSLGVPLLLAGAEAAAAHWPHKLRRIVGHVLLTNEPSLRSFRRAGFAEGVDSDTPINSASFELAVAPTEQPDAALTDE